MCILRDGKFYDDQFNEVAGSPLPCFDRGGGGGGVLVDPEDGTETTNDVSPQSKRRCSRNNIDTKEFISKLNR